jgi:large subunit ribosomal protein L4
MKVTVYSQTGEKKGDITLNKDIFGHEVNEGLIHQMLVLQQANARSPIAHTKTRGEIRGGGRKPHRQKGTGRARTGSIRTPIHRGGGTVFGPRNTRNFTLMMPKKQRRKALFCALSSKANDKQILVLDKYETKEVKTKAFADMIGKLPVERNALVVLPEKNEIMQKSARNLPNVKTVLAGYLNIQDLFKYNSLIFLKDALPKLEETFLKA